MNLCDERHEPKYRVTYKAAHGHNYAHTVSTYNPEWLVCKTCMQNKRHFYSDDQVKSVEVLV